MSAEASKRGRAARRKGGDGEREVARLIRDLTGWDVRRRVRNHASDSDLTGVPNWSLEVKNCAGAKLGDVRAWWLQAVLQAQPGGCIPVLIYKRQPGEWRAVWPGEIYAPDSWNVAHAYAHEGSLEAWAAVAREWAGGASVSPEPQTPLSGAVCEPEAA